MFSDVPDDLPFFWPDPAFPRWPVRAKEPLSIEDALELLGSPPLDGREKAGLCTPGPTTWVHRGRTTRISPVPVPPQVPSHGRGRQPDEAALAAVEAEAETPNFRFYPEDHPDPPLDGLVVLDHVDRRVRKGPVLRIA